MKAQAFLNCCSKKKLINFFFYNRKPKIENNFKIKIYKRKFMMCQNCCHMFSHFNFNLQNLYNSKYSKGAYGDLNTIKRTFNKIISLPRKKSDNKKRIQRCLKYINHKTKILDIGCGLGVFLYELNKNGFLIKGIEPDKNLFKHVNIILKKKILNYNLNKFCRLSKKRFEFISLNKVLEHVAKPSIMIEKIYKLLSPKGILYVEVPDQEASKHGKLREEFMVEHLHVFSKSSLENLMIKKKFKVLRTKQLIEPSGKFTIIGFFQKV